ncbi:MAG: multidrug effflux MFS transporter [Candidatus Thiodiazotropha sp.]
MNQAATRHPGFVLLLAMITALAPLAIDTYLPAFPAMSEHLGVSSHELSLTISVYIFVLSFAQLIGGPLSDRIGRSPVVLSGLVIFSLASFAVAGAEQLESIILLRGVQAFGGGWAMVCVPALVRDHVSGREAAKIFSMIGLIMVAAPAFAPSIGSLLLGLSGWNLIFIFLGCYGVFMILALKLTLFTGPNRIPLPSRSSLLEGYRAVFRTRPALRFILMQALAFSVMILFITHSSFIYQEHFQVGPTLFALLFGANILIMTLMNLINRLLLNHYTPRQILRFAMSLQALGILALLLILQLAPHLQLVVPAFMLSIGAMGAISPNNQASCMEYFPTHSGSAAALMGATQFSVAGAVSALSSLLPEQISAIVLAMASCSALCLILVWSPFRD